MGQPVTVIEKPSARPDIVRFETNRVLTGMGHERFATLDDAQGPTPAARLARTLLPFDSVVGVHVNGNVITVHLAPGASTDGLKEAVEELYLYYREGVEVVVPEGVEAS
jgi:hypothetical protein